MAEEKRPDDSGKPNSGPSQEVLDKLGSDWGDDWESAFQSEGGDSVENLSPEDEGFFLGDEEEGQEEGGHPRSGSRLGDDDDESAAGEAYAKTGPNIAALLALFLSLPERIPPLVKRFKALPTPRKIMAGGGLLALLLAAALLFRLTSPPQPLEIVLPADPFDLGESRPPGEPLFADEQAPTAPADPQTFPDQEALAPAEPLAALAEPPPRSEQRRMKLAGFFIPLEDQAAPGGQAFIHLDLSLSLQVAPGAELDRLLEPVLRDSIYRFYQRQNRETLRRYSLARGEMLRDLREWLSGKHPELEIATIAFDRYWIN